MGTQLQPPPTVHLSIKAPQPLRDRLDALARKHGVTRSRVARLALERGADALDTAPMEAA